MPIALPVDASIAVPKDAYGSELSSERDFSKPRMVVLAGDCCVVYLYWGGGRRGEIQICFRFADTFFASKNAS